MPIHAFQDLTCFSNIKSITFSALKLVHQVGEFEVREGVVGIG